MSEADRAGPPLQRVWLAGLMGAGKTTVGRSLAERLGWPYLDNDAELAELAGTATPLVAQDLGVARLHALESQVLAHNAALPPPFVAGVAASAGDRPADLDLARATGLLVYLRADAATLVARVSADPTDRPLVHHQPQDVLAGMVARRDPAFVAAAELVLDARRPPDELVEDIARALQR